MNDLTSPPQMSFTHFQGVFESLPGNLVLVRADPPMFTILSITDSALLLLQKARKEVIDASFVKIISTGRFDKPSGWLGQKIIDSFGQLIESKTSQQIILNESNIRGLSNTQLQGWSLKITSKPIINEDAALSFILVTLEKIEEDLRLQQVGSFQTVEKAYNFFMNAPVIIGVLKGDDYIIEMANEGLLEVWDRSSEVVGKPLLSAIPELKEQGFITLLENVRNSGEPFYAYEFPITLTRHGQAEVLYFDFVYKPLYDNESDHKQKAQGIMSVGHDVTTQVLAKKKVIESEAKYRTLFETMDQGFCVLEIILDEKNTPVDYRFVEINPVFEKLTGLKDALGKTAKELLPDLENHWIERYGKVALSGDAVRFSEESQVMGKWFDVFAFAIGPTNELRVALLFTDITEQIKAAQNLRESEERFRKLADESPMFVFIIESNEQPLVTYWNKTWLDYTGQSMEEALGRAWDGIVHLDDEPLVMNIYRAAFEKKHAYYLPSVRVKRNDGEYRWHAFKANPRYSSDGEFKGYVGVGFDIHEQKLAEEIIRQSEARLQVKVQERTAELERTVLELKRSNINLQEFAYAASHDLKEPVRKIRVFTDRLNQSLLGRISDDEKRTFERIVVASKRMSTLIEDLLTYSQVSLGPSGIQKVDLNQVMNFVLEDLDLEIEETKAIVKVEKLITIDGNHRQLQQAFQNLISNSLKYAKPGIPPIIHVTCKPSDDDDIKNHLLPENKNKTFYELCFQDNGIGFHQQDAERIFNVFTRLHGTSEFRGTGIGLSIVRKVIENHQGFITAKSSINAGASFNIYLQKADL
jgi:hypothetical protein